MQRTSPSSSPQQMPSPKLSVIPREDRSRFYFGDPCDRRLHVRNIPIEFDDWEVFHIFRRFGRVHNVSLPPAKWVGVGNGVGKFRFGFVDMLSLADVDRVLNKADAEGMLRVEGLKTPLVVQRAYNSNDRQRSAAVAPNKTGGGDSSCNDGEPQLRSDSGVSLLEEEKRLLSPSSLVKIQEYAVVKYRPQVHRCDELPFYRIISDVVFLSVGELSEKYKQHTFYVMMLKRRAELKQFEGFLTEFYEKTNAVKSAEVDDMVMFRRDGFGLASTARARVVDVKAEWVTVDCVDVGRVVDVPPDALHALPHDLSQYPFLAIPCSLYGISDHKEEYAEKEKAMLAKATAVDELRIRLVGYRGIVNLVQLWFVTKGSDKTTVVDVGKSLAKDLQVCKYKRFTEDRIIYPREVLLSLQDNCINTSFALDSRFSSILR